MHWISNTSLLVLVIDVLNSSIYGSNGSFDLRYTGRSDETKMAGVETCENCVSAAAGQRTNGEHDHNDVSGAWVRSALYRPKLEVPGLEPTLKREVF